MISFLRSTFSSNHANLVRVPLLLFLVVVYESEAHKMKYCGPKLIRKMFEVCEVADCTQFGDFVNKDGVGELLISDRCCKRGCTHRDVEAFCCGVDPSLVEPNNNTPKLPMISTHKKSIYQNSPPSFYRQYQKTPQELPELWKPYYFF